MLSEHLVSGSAAGNTNGAASSAGGAGPAGALSSTSAVGIPQTPGADDFSISHSLLGGAITRDIYKRKEELDAAPLRRRASEPDLSVALSTSASETHASHLREPGVFRREYMARVARTENRPAPNPITRNFIDFLLLYGFYGGDVWPDEDDEDDEAGDGHDEGVVVDAVRGTTPQKAFFMLVKAFVGTGVLFLPKAFSFGGIAFSTILMIVLGGLTLHCMILLVELNRELGGSFGDIGERLYGPKVRQMVIWSIAFSQMGFCAAYYIFVAQNLRDLTMIVSHCQIILPDWIFIVLQAFIYTPLVWVRKIKHFSVTSLIADAFILVGLGYVFYHDLVQFGAHGIATDVVWINWDKFPLFVGTAMFSFEGICLILPIVESMDEPEKFPAVMSWCVFTIGTIFIVIGALGYLAFGSVVETNIFLNMPKGTATTEIIQFFYAIAIILSFPLCMYPAVRINEQAIFGIKNGKSSTTVKWQKNMFRMLLTFALAFVAWAGSANLDKFVALVGCFACIPLSFIYPSIFHYHIAKTRWVRMKDLALVVLGTLAMFYATAITLQQWFISEPDIPKGRC
ncbi:hypothetical protein CXG81DRAFT_12981 [Caulochytrium protostelioides]|uniref:Amino acid transporter transmembrane domain-containing protein n=1 Tax=Caulochytrium protostelioides TaxID=1555241 RepID=A0A4P9WX84_9FUNG|nr:hypothetical protein CAUPRSCDRAFT_5507 [Caulochytrium protostelioides]RKP00635.1 hypothetical protein CXG81DRAFT_12981 [Caulochytrium protostelioides]|eukprot:RKP00635.1 hypothetical protein CXG81DRAFT_12981 [Caulochytrium protostelioides]